MKLISFKQASCVIAAIGMMIASAAYAMPVNCKTKWNCYTSGDIMVCIKTQICDDA